MTGWLDAWEYGVGVDGRKDRWMHGWQEIWLVGCMTGRINGWLAGVIDRLSEG